MGVDVPDEVMVALSKPKRRISLLLDHQAGQLVQPGQTATAIMMSTVLSVSRMSSCWHQSPYAMALVSWTHVEARGLPRLLCEFGLWTTCWHM